MAKRKIKKKRFIKLLLTVFFFLFIFSYFFNFSKQDDYKTGFPKNQKEEQKEQEREYNACLNRKFNETDINDNLNSIRNGINEYIKKNHYEVSVFYEDLTTGFSYSYKPTTIYYGASLIKLVDALYLINEAIIGNVNLDTETITYTEKYKKAFSSGLATHKYGDKVSLRNLITYAISVSDNSAHMMLIDYIGFSKLKSYGESLGAKVILTGGDNFGSQTAEDTNIYLNEAYRIIKENEKYGPFLKNIMDNSERNAFNTDTIKIYHKYGSYGDNYHDIGLSLEEKPYAISILTLHENSGYKEIVQEIHKRVRELHQSFYDSRQNVCHAEIYEK